MDSRADGSARMNHSFAITHGSPMCSPCRSSVYILVEHYIISRVFHYFLAAEIMSLAATNVERQFNRVINYGFIVNIVDCNRGQRMHLTHFGMNFMCALLVCKPLIVLIDGVWKWSISLYLVAAQSKV